MSSRLHEQLQNDLSAAAEVLNRDSDLTFKPMFGGIIAYLDGRPIASLSNIGLALKFAAKDQVELLTVDGAKRLQYEPDSPPSKQYIVIPPAIQADPQILSQWLQRSSEYILSLPGKKTKA